MGDAAGYLADRYSKRNALVMWKVAEVLICAVAALGFYLGRNGEETVGPWLVLGTVFLMGTHSAFFVPAKYGVMPEILQPHLLSRGNGILESLSFLAVILTLVLMDPAAAWPAVRPPREPGQIRAGLRYVSSTPALLVPLLMILVVGALAWEFQISLPLLADHLSAGPSVAGAARGRRAEPPRRSPRSRSRGWGQGHRRAVG